ncbi:hypothetical protein MUK42_24967 [Musa troglodytarum]|uniref:Uncharacterized protein n=1 Tax=Musa troglodytarum TaxID=320322 RepID=A0A9E7GGU1_9LILI|nr:hypothetical protein MUK42_24967 [Musa troglodytarum]
MSYRKKGLTMISTRTRGCRAVARSFSRSSASSCCSPSFLSSYGAPHGRTSRMSL